LTTIPTHVALDARVSGDRLGEGFLRPDGLRDKLDAMPTHGCGDYKAQLDSAMESTIDDN